MPGWIANETVERVWRSLLDPIAGYFSEKGYSPDVLTMAGLPLMMVAGFTYAKGWLFWSALFIFLSGMLDILDGQVARKLRTTSGGAFLDSTLDRWGELFLFLGLATLFRDSVFFFVAILALGGSFITSYARARAEGLGEKCREGAFQRPERLIVMGSCAILNYLLNLWRGKYSLILVKAGLLVVMVFALFTAIQRTYSVYRRLKGKTL